MQLLLSSPGQLGLARAYVAGELDVDGDMYDGPVQPGATSASATCPPRTRCAWPALSRRYAKGFRRVPPPPEEVRLHGDAAQPATRRRGHLTTTTTSATGSTSWVLGPSMAYTCAVYPKPDSTLEEAQEEKFDLVARKLDLRPGQRLLDIGCGWGGMVLHAVKNYGVTAIGVTLSQQQADYAQRQIADAGLQDRAQVRFQDYRDVPEGDFDAVSSIGLTEHIGRRELPGVLLVHPRQAASGGPAAQPLHHPHRHQVEDDATATGSSTVTCSPTVSWCRSAASST